MSPSSELQSQHGADLAIDAWLCLKPEQTTMAGTCDEIQVFSKAAQPQHKVIQHFGAYLAKSSYDASQNPPL